MTSDNRDTEAGPKFASRRFVWALCVLSVVLLGGLGVMTWRLVAVSDELNRLTASPLTTIFEDQWLGNHGEYVIIQSGIITQRARLRATFLDEMWSHDAGSGLEAMLNLAMSLNDLPYSPPGVKEAEDAYYEGLMALYDATCAATADDSTDNMAAFADAWNREPRLLQSWQRATEGAH